MYLIKSSYFSKNSWCCHVKLLGAIKERIKNSYKEILYHEYIWNLVRVKGGYENSKWLPVLPSYRREL